MLRYRQFASPITFSAILSSTALSLCARVFASHQQRAGLVPPKTLRRGDPGTRVDLAYHPRRPMTAPDTLALIRDVYLQIEKHIVLRHVTTTAWDENKNSFFPREAPDTPAGHFVTTSRTREMVRGC